jgi:hypothetical protein
MGELLGILVAGLPMHAYMALVSVGAIKDGTHWYRNLVEDVSDEIRAHAQMIPRKP